MNDDSSARIVHGLRAWLADAPAGAQLPSTRSLAAQYAAGPGTVQRALRNLTAAGVIESRPGVGTFVRGARTPRTHDYGWQTAALGAPTRPAPDLSTALRATDPDSLALHAGYPDQDLLPGRLLRAAFARSARSDAVLRRPPAAGSDALRAWFAAQVAAVTPDAVSPATAGDVLIVPGSQTGLASVFRAIVGPGRPVVLESPTYWGAILAAAAAGVQVVPVAGGTSGPDPSAVADAMDRTGATVFYAQPHFANPTGVCWPAAVADEILEVVRARGGFLVEDDWAHDFALDTPPAPLAARDDAGHVILLRSLTKSVSPAVRVAAVIVRGPARRRLLADLQSESMYVSGLLQAVALDVVTQPGWPTHLRSLRTQLRARRDLLVEAVRAHLPSADLPVIPRGGLNLWVRLPDHTDLTRLVRDCDLAGVLIAPGGEWFPAEPTGPFLRLNYAGPHPGDFADGVRVIGEALAQQSRTE